MIGVVKGVFRYRSITRSRNPLRMSELAYASRARSLDDSAPHMARNPSLAGIAEVVIMKIGGWATRGASLNAMPSFHSSRHRRALRKLEAG